MPILGTREWFAPGLLASVDLKPLKSEPQCTNKNHKLRQQDFSSYMEYLIMREAYDICSLNCLLGFTQRFGQQDMISRKQGKTNTQEHK